MEIDAGTAGFARGSRRRRGLRGGLGGGRRDGGRGRLLECSHRRKSGRGHDRCGCHGRNGCTQGRRDRRRAGCQLRLRLGHRGHRSRGLPSGLHRKRSEAALDRLQIGGMGLGHRLQIRGVCLRGLPLGILIGLRPARICRDLARRSGERQRGREGRRLLDDRHGLREWRRGSDRRRRRYPDFGLAARRLDVHGLHHHFFLTFGVRSRQRGGAARRRIGLAVVAATNRDRELRRDPIARILGLGKPRPQGFEFERVAEGREPPERLEEAANAVPALAIEVHYNMRPVLENTSHQTSQHRPWPHLYEAANAGFVHRLDHVDELHRAGELRGELRAQHCGVRIVRSTGRIRVDGPDRGGELDFFQVGAKRAAGLLDDRRVEGSRDREPPCSNLLLGELSLDRLDLARLSGEHHLIRRVVIRDHYRGVPALQ